MSINIPKVIPDDWVRLRIIIDKLKHLRLGGDSSPEFSGLTLTDLTASKLVATDANKALASKDLVDLVAGTSNRVTVADDSAGGITLSGPQDIHTGANPTFAGVTTTGTIDASAGEVLVEDNDTSEPTGKSDGYMGVATVGGTSRIYFTIGGLMYYVDGTVVAAIPPVTGNPIGLLLTLTYDIP